MAIWEIKKNLATRELGEARALHRTRGAGSKQEPNRTGGVSRLGVLSDSRDSGAPCERPLSKSTCADSTFANLRNMELNIIIIIIMRKTAMHCNDALYNFSASDTIKSFTQINLCNVKLTTPFPRHFSRAHNRINPSGRMAPWNKPGLKRHESQTWQHARPYISKKLANGGQTCGGSEFGQTGCGDHLGQQTSANLKPDDGQHQSPQNDRKKQLLLKSLTKQLLKL